MFKIKQEKLDFYLPLGFFILLFAIAPLYYQANMGGIGLELSFNIPLWAVATTFITAAVLIITGRNTISLPHGYLYILAVPVFIVLIGLIGGASQPVSLLFRELYVVGGLLFFLALFQFNLGRTRVEWILLAICLSTLVHSLIGVVQVFSPELLGNWYATSNDGLPRGVFQQINVQVTFLATGITLAFYLLSRPVAGSFSHVVSALLILSVGLGTFIVIVSGSRVGLLSISLALPMLLIFRRKQLLNRKLLVGLALVALALGVVMGRKGLDRTLQKSMNVTQSASSEVRLNMYSIALELVAQKPLTGHGIGNYLRVWNLQAGDYVSRHPQAKLPEYILHPHNELIFWMIEGGLLIVSGILLAVFAVIRALIRCGPQRGGAYAAMLLPITLHTQVELPFYISSLHWFLWLFLIFLVMRHRVFKTAVKTSIAANKLIQVVSLVVCVGTLYFLQHTSRAQSDIMAYLNRTPGNQPYLQVALNNHYFRQQAEELAMRSILYNGLSTNNSQQVKEYVEWSQKRLAISPELKLFEDLIEAYSYLNDEKSRCGIIRLGVSMYPQNVPLRGLNQSCGN